MLSFLLLSLAPWALAAAPAESPPPTDVTRPLTLFRFDEPASLEPWRPVHDGVMGGVSRGRATWSEGAARFEGRVSLENNGGFASFRAAVDAPDLTSYDGLRLVVRGDGQVYKLGLRTGGQWSEVGWQAPFGTTAGEWTTVHVAFADLAPTWRGRLVGDAPPIDLERVREVGLVIADKQAGPFTLEVTSIEAWRVEDEPAEAGTRAAARDRTRALAARIDAGADGEALADALRWSERVLIVAEPARGGDLGAEASRQIGRLAAEDGAAAERELRVLHLLGDRGGRLAGRTLGPDAVAALRARWELPRGAFGVALVGKDGGVKARWSEPVAPDPIFARIDAMPMRADEVDRRR